MNDFTKDELQTIYLNLCVNFKTNAVLKKIETMITDYDKKPCDHEEDGFSYDKDLPRFDAKGVMIIPKLYNKCRKCGKFYR